MNRVNRRPTFMDTPLKRLFDVTLAAAGLLLLAPLLVAIAAAIKLSDGGPVLYCATRVGLHGHLFRLYKFRTMRIDADRTGAGITTSGDPRITRIGRWLRRSKLDELPQLFNVLRGDMSLVGPRPEDPRYVTFYTPLQCQILNVRPGITSAASLEYRNEESLLTGDWERLYRSHVLPTKLAIDLAYLARRTLWSDIVLICRTLKALAN